MVNFSIINISKGRHYPEKKIIKIKIEAKFIGSSHEVKNFSYILEYFEKESEEIATLLIKNGADVEAKIISDGTTPLHHAAR